MDSFAEYDWPFPEWASGLLACPNCGGVVERTDGALNCGRCGVVGRWEDGIARFGALKDDPSIAWYLAKEGTYFMERTKIPFTMTSLDTPVYHSYLQDLKPKDRDSVIVDVGAGDGRNTEPWLHWGYGRVVAIDPVLASLMRFREWVHDHHPEWKDRLMFVEGDARRLPIISGGASIVLAIEVLYYLNEEYKVGLKECCRILSSEGSMLLSDRSWEGALLTRLLYGGVQAMLGMRHSRDMYDDTVRSRTFTEDELLSAVRDSGLEVVQRKGLSVLSVVLGYLRGKGMLSSNDEGAFDDVVSLLNSLGEEGKALRCYVFVACKPKRRLSRGAVK